MINKMPTHTADIVKYTYENDLQFAVALQVCFVAINSKYIYISNWKSKNKESEFIYIFWILNYLA